MVEQGIDDQERGVSPASRGGAGSYVEGELGAFYLLVMLGGSEPYGLPGAHLEGVRFQAADQGYALDDLVLHGSSATGLKVLEIQSKRTITFAPKDSVFQDVCRQVAKSGDAGGAEDHHLLSVATQRTSRQISGPYQDVLQWANIASTSEEFFTRLASKGVGNADMRTFVETFRLNLVAAGMDDDDDVIWRLLRRFLILEFDFEAEASMARTHALSLGRQVLSDEDVARAEALWSSLIDISLNTAKSGGIVDRKTLREELVRRGFALAGDRDFGQARANLAEMTKFSLASIDNTIAGVHLLRSETVDAVDEALGQSRYVEIRGLSGVGKSSVLRHVAERMSRRAPTIFLDPIATPAGGWGSLASYLGTSVTANSLLTDLAVSGGATIFIDSLEMFTDPRQQRTVNDLLREATAVGGFKIVATARPDFGKDGEAWLAADVLGVVGTPKEVVVSELKEDEIELLREQAPALRALLAPAHPAAPMVRNLYRLSRLLKVSDSSSLRTEAALATHWWTTADGAPQHDLRAAQRILADLVDATLNAQATLEIRTDSAARGHLLRTSSVREVRRDQFVFYHDVLRDWAVACRLHEDPGLLANLDLTKPISPRVARGVELAGRLALERSEDCSVWRDLMTALSPVGAHGSWRRQALLAIVRSEIGMDLLDRCSDQLLADGAGLFQELCRTIISVETVATVDLLNKPELGQVAPLLSRDLRTNTTGTAIRLLLWALPNQGNIPLQAIGSVLDLVELQFFVLLSRGEFAAAVAKMLFGWLYQLDVDGAERTMPSDDGGRLRHRGFGRLVTELRSWSLLLAQHAPDEARKYMAAVAAERDHQKVKAIRGFSASLAPVAASELAELVFNSLVEPEESKTARRRPYDRTFTFSDTDYLPASPAQPPFLDLLEAAPDVGLDLISKLTAEAVEFHSVGAEPGENGFRLEFSTGTRFFPWVDSYLWSRDQAREYSVASGLKALEAWGHARLDAGESVDQVLADILGPEGSCAAYLLVAIDVLISHWPASREALVPFMSCPELLAFERSRQTYDQIGAGKFGTRQEPTGKVRLDDLAKRPSRQLALENVLPYYHQGDAVSDLARAQLGRAVAKLGPVDPEATFGDPAFMGTYALNLLAPANWKPIEGHPGYLAYQSPPDEAEHLARLSAHLDGRTKAMTIDSKVRMAIRDRTRGSPELARAAAEHVKGALPDDSDPDVMKMRSTLLVATAMQIARDGDDALLDEYEPWVRSVVAATLAEDKDDRGSEKLLEYNQSALALCALVHLWRRRGRVDDRNQLIAACTRNDRAAAVAFSASLDAIIAKDPRLLKSAIRAGLATCRWRWQPWDEDPTERESWLKQKAATDRAAVEAEIAWLDGGAEPEWSTFPADLRTARHARRISVGARVEDEDAPDFAAERDRASVHVNTQAAAKWLALVTGKAGSSLAWRAEIVDAYSEWSAQLNGLGLPGDVEPDQRYNDWNYEFYILLANALLDSSNQKFETEIVRVTELPDKTFSAVAETLIHAADVTYFNDPNRPADRAIELRERLVKRTIEMRSWRRNRPTDDLSVDFDTGGVTARLLFNTHDPFNGTESYLVPAVADRLDPLLETLSPLMTGGPTPFVAPCTMNMLLVAPRVRHMDFLLAAVETWLDWSQGDSTMWLELRLGSKVIDWFNAVATEDPQLLNSDHHQQARIDTILGRLVDLGIPEAYELASRIAKP